MTSFIGIIFNFLEEDCRSSALITMVRMTNEERQKKYRERKKSQEGDAYLKKECSRVKKYYVPTTQLAPRKLEKRREVIRESMRKSRKKSYVNAAADTDQTEHCILQQPSEEEPGPCDSTVSNTNLEKAEPSCLKIKMSFKARSKKRKATTQLNIERKKVKTLTQKLEEVNRRNSCLRKRIQRIKRKSSPIKKSNQTTVTEAEKKPSGAETEATPKSKTTIQVESLNITPKSKKKVFKQLHFHNCMLEQVRKSVKNCVQNKRPLLRIVCGKILHKYKMGRNLGKQVQLNRRQIRKARECKDTTKTRQTRERQMLHAKVKDFMERDDNSTNLPGKKDCRKVGNEKVQKRVLNDYLYNLHLKFRAENSQSNISLSVFSRLRPKHIQLVQFKGRKTCLCQRHQNMVLKCKALRELKVLTIENPDTLVKNLADNELLEKIEDIGEEKIKFSEWRRVTVEKKGRTFKRMQIVQVEESKERFKSMLSKELKEFREHIDRVKAQYEQSRKLKEELPLNHAICHMDFAENYLCTFAEEIQSAYFDKGSVTLHPVVVYTRNNETNEIEHKSFVVVSDETTHAASTVFAIMKPIVADVQDILPNCEMIHYMTDSPTSQYRNSKIFSVIANHDKIFNGIKASWLYFESGHGKGPCDGVGGTAKRLADMAVKRNLFVIQSAQDFYNWGRSQENSKLKYVFVPKSECEEASKELYDMTIKPLKGTMQVHAVVALEDGTIAVKDTSCYCSNCFKEGKFYTVCPGWSKPKLIRVKDITDLSETETYKEKESRPEGQNYHQNENANNEDAGSEEEADKADQIYAVDSFVAALYDKKCYIGKVLEFDQSDNEYNISFMVQSKKSLKWPNKPDTVWISAEDVIMAVDEPVNVGKTRNMYRLKAQDMEKIDYLN